jgi:EAL and modified HD-GYP domain-containing signal transduction protein
LRTDTCVIPNFGNIKRKPKITVVNDFKLSTGESAGKYQILRKLADFQFGSVYSALGPDVASGSVALKIFSSAFDIHHPAIDYFNNEMMRLTKFDNPYFVRVLDSGVHMGHCFLVMDFVSVEDLNMQIAVHAPYPEFEALSIAYTVAGALEQAQSSHGITHGMLSPASVLIDPDFNLMIKGHGLSGWMSKFISDGKPVFINFTRAFLTGVIPLPVEPDRVVLEVVDNVVADRELMIGLQQLREAGYRIAIHDFQGQVDRSALLDLTDFVKIDVNNVSPILLPGLVKACASAGATLVAKGIEDSFVFDHCLNLGFELFQGYYLQRPTVLEQRTLSPSQLICVRLLNDLADPDVPISRIEHMVGSDPGLTLRLLRTANSAAAGSTREVTSLRQALVLIGPRRLRSWVVLTLLEGGTTSNASDDLWRVLARAFACQKLAASEEDLAFTVGLLSGCAELLGSDLMTVVEGSGVGSEARHALVDGAGSAGHALTAVLAHEHDDTTGIESAGLIPFDVSRAYLESLSESLQLVHELTGHS